MTREVCSFGRQVTCENFSNLVLDGQSTRQTNKRSPTVARRMTNEGEDERAAMNVDQIGPSFFTMMRTPLVS